MEKMPPSPLASLFDIIELKESSLLLSTLENNISATVKFDKNWTYAGTELFYFFSLRAISLGKDFRTMAISCTRKKIYRWSGLAQMARRSGIPCSGDSPSMTWPSPQVSGWSLRVRRAWPSWISVPTSTRYMIEFPFEEAQVTSYDGAVGLRQNVLTALSSRFESVDTHGFSIEKILDYSIPMPSIVNICKNSS